MLICSFCGKSSEEVSYLITGPGVDICDECIDFCTEILKEARNKRSAFEYDLKIEAHLAELMA